jgi:glycosyltransferase involved in cell wall biosynthesis
MPQKIFYWSPFFSKVGTVTSVINSARALQRYSNKEYEVCIIDSIGEWGTLDKKLIKDLNFIKIYSFPIYNLLPKGGFIKSRISQLIIFFYSFFNLFKVIKKEKPNFLIANLITSLPIFLSLIIQKDCRLILRISGLPKLHFFRRFFWKIFSSKIYKVTTPTIATRDYLKELNIFDNSKIRILRDPIISIAEINLKKKEQVNNKIISKNNTIIAIGRLTKQKNFELLIEAFKEISLKAPQLNLVIIGEGELKSKLQNKIRKLFLSDKVFLLGYQSNVYKFLNNAKCFVLSSLWEDPGFVIVEAAACNLPIISSNCPNGPIEILDKGKNGYLFDNNNKDDLVKVFFSFFKNYSRNNLKKIIEAKRTSNLFSHFRHFKEISKLIKES